MVYKTLSIKNNYWHWRQYFYTSWVPRGSKPNTYSAPTIASNQLLVLLFQKSSQSVFDFHQLLVTSAPVYKRCWENFSNCLQCCLAVSKILYNLLIVVKNIEPPGFSNCEHFLKKCSLWQKEHSKEWAIREEDLWVVHMLDYFTGHHGIIARPIQVLSMLQFTNITRLEFTAGTSSTVQHW